MTEATRIPQLVVGIGASAGGLEAVAELLGSLPLDAGIAVIVVQHLDPRHESLLSDILGKKTRLPVSVARSGEIVYGDHVYVIPPDVTLTVRDGRIELRPRSTGREPSLPVDVLLTSLADAYGENAIAVVLSGGGADGSLGVQAVRRAGGTTFAQSPATAHFPDMPRHAIETGCVDLVLSASEIARDLARLGRQRSAMPPTSEQATHRDSDSGTDEGSLRHIFRRLRSVHGVDFSHYKQTTIRRRLQRRMLLRRMDSLEEYRALIDSDAVELAALYEDFLIRVTAFFRDPEAFDTLREFVLPTLFAGRSGKQPIRIWIPGCATGEEVYSVAIVLLEYLGDTASSARIQIFGTDVNEMSLQEARAGVYSVSALNGVSAERRQRFFTKQDDEFAVAKEVRTLCLFARQDVTRDPPFSRVDLISCRNLLIYLDSAAQQRVLRAFHYALRPDGMLFCGPAESIGLAADLFEQVDKRFRAYRRLPAHAAVSGMPRTLSSDPSVFGSEKTDISVDVDPEPSLREADRLLLGRFAPPSLLVNHALTILQFRGETGPYLEPAGGAPSFDLRRVVRPELLVHIAPAIQEASSKETPSRRDVRLQDGREVGIEIIPLTGSRSSRSFLILFDDASRSRANGELALTVALPQSEKDRRLVELERDIGALRAYVRSAIEEHSAIEEELRSAHEEMLSANEEFQSTNEELETSKEELQAANEELTTTIDELRHRNQDLVTLNAELERTRIAAERARSYADIIIEAVHEPLAVLDSAQRILRVNPAFSSDLEISREEAEGRLLQEVDHGRWNIPDLPARLHQVMNGGRAMEEWEVPVELARHGRRVMSLTARKIPADSERAVLLLLSFHDVTATVNAAADLVAANDRKDQFLAMLGHELRHPLTPITHAVYLLKRGNPDPRTAELLDSIDTETQRLRRFVDELLDVARISHGLIEVRHDAVDLVSVVRTASRAVEPFIGSRHHAFSMVLPTASVYVRGDSGRLGQVVTNLLENAAKYTQPGGQITLTLEQRDGGIVLSVRDNGIGIAPENLQRVFEPFTQAHRGQRNGNSGLGLGLSVARRVVELHGGHIKATSAGLTKGSEFLVWLPLLPQGEADALVSERRAQTPAAPVPLAQARRVLIVDDHEEVRQSLGRLVHAFGHEVATASDGPSALALADSFRPHAAIVDVSLEGMSGTEVGRRLRQRFPRDRLSLIALTGFADVDIREACLGAGFDAHLVKPGEIPQLEQLLAAAPLDA